MSVFISNEWTFIKTGPYIPQMWIMLSASQNKPVYTAIPGVVTVGVVTKNKVEPEHMKNATSERCFFLFSQAVKTSREASF